MIFIINEKKNLWLVKAVTLQAVAATCFSYLYTIVNSIVINRSALNITAQEPEYNKSIKDFMSTQHEFDTLDDFSRRIFACENFFAVEFNR